MAAAREHFAALQSLPDRPSRFPLAYYLAGLAVECLFRAYSELTGGRHDAKHDLRLHAENGRFLDFMPRDQREDVQADIGDVWTRWLNNHRYRSVASLRRYLNENELYRLAGGRTIKGDVVEYNWGILQEASLRLLTIGIQRWEPSKAKWNRS